MPRSVDRDEVERLVRDEGGQVVEVLDAEQYEWSHVEGAVNIPMPELDRRASQVLDRRRPVIVYCNDFL